MDVQLILGAPGCGKTTTLLNILEKELQIVEPNRIAYVSFTKKGAYEGRDRALEKFSYNKDDFLFFKTLHSIAFYVAGFTKSDVIKKQDYKKFSELLDMKFTGYYTEDFYHNDDKYLFLDNLIRNTPSAVPNYMVDIDNNILNMVINNYALFKKRSSVIDFTDMLQEFVKINEPLPVSVAIIDEAQDLTTLQWKMCQIAFKNCSRVYIAGDDDQAIYEWSGADVKHFLNIKAPKNILNKSYRLPSELLTLAKELTKNITSRIDKQFDASYSGGIIEKRNTVEEIQFNLDESYYLLSRNNWFLSNYKKVLMKKCLLFYYKGKLSISKKEINAINIFERLRKKEKITEKEMVRLKVYLGNDIDTSKPWYEVFPFDVDQTNYYRDLIKNQVDLSIKPKIHIDTIHGVKGGEADNVVLMLDFTRAVKHNFDRNPDSELRCLYVACTRAIKKLILIHAQGKYGYDDFFDFSRF